MYAIDPPDAVRQVIHTRNGTPIAFTLSGRAGAGRRAVLVHSLALDRHVWSQVAALLGDAGQVVTLDCRGHGESGREPMPYSVEGLAEDLFDLVEALGWRAPLVAGASMGGCVALAHAAAFPGRLSGLGLVDTTAWYGPTAAQDWEERARRGSEAGGLTAMADFQATRWFSEGFRTARAGFLAECLAAFQRMDPVAYAAACRMLGAADLRAHLPAITVPAAVVVGEEDYATPPAMARAMAEAIPGARLTILPGARHLTTMEAPQAVADALRAVWRAEP